METIFLYEKTKINWGSTILRGFNIANRLKCEILPFDENIRGKRIICLKFNYFIILDLAKNNEIILDMVDFKHSKKRDVCDILKNFDYGIFCSLAQKNKFMNLFKYPEKCVVIYHHWDERLNNVSAGDISHIKIGYFGNEQKCHLFNQIKDINYYITSNYQNFSKTLSDYSKCNVHYIIKPEKYEKDYVSMAKLANASALFCPVITLKECYDEFLTDNYPFYCNSNNINDIQNTIDDIKKNFNTGKWNEAVNIMKLVKEKTSIDSALKKYNEIILN